VRFIDTHVAPRPAGHYSQAVVHGGLVFVAGQLPIDPSAPAAPPDPTGSPADVEAQTEQALRNVGAILEAAGTDLGHLVSVTVYVSDIALWPRVNAAFARVLGDHRPARAVVPVKQLHNSFLVEIQAVAALPDE
jgi:2-iminobutanoate/2-iminopropanoate deaminase